METAYSDEITVTYEIRDYITLEYLGFTCIVDGMAPKHGDWVDYLPDSCIQPRRGICRMSIDYDEEQVVFV